MREYTIIRKPKSGDWNQVPELAIDTALWGTDADIRAWAQLCWDDGAIHVRLRAQEREIRAEHARDSLLGMPCEDSCLEFFFCPIPGDERYFNIEFNPNGCLYLGFGRSLANHVRLLPGQPCFETTPARIPDGWEIVYRIPHAFVRDFFPDYAPKAGDEIRANCYKCGDLTAREHYYSWNPCTSDTPAFHRPHDFGRMRFG